MYVLHGIDDWGSLVIHMALGVTGAPYRYHRLDYVAGDLQSPAYKALNPFGRIPLLETPDGAIYETAAILTYLSEHHEGMAPKLGEAGRAEFLVLFTLVTNLLHPMTMFLVHPDKAAGEECKAAVSTKSREKVVELLAHFDAAAGTGHWWFGTKTPSILSLYVAMLLRWSQCFAHISADNIPLTPYKNLTALARATEDHPQVRKVLTDEGLSGTALSDPNAG